MSMSILPAFILTALGLLANLTLSLLGLAQGDGAWFALRSLLECMGSILATLLVLGGAVHEGGVEAHPPWGEAGRSAHRGRAALRGDGFPRRCPGGQSRPPLRRDVGDAVPYKEAYRVQ